MRPLYETPADRARELAAARALGEAWWCEMIPAPPLAPFDYYARRGTLVAVVEIKSRLNREPGDFGGLLFVNAHKLAALTAEAGRAGAHPVFAWHFPAAIRWVNAATLAGRPAEVRGRTDRDGLDQRPAVRVRLAETTRVLLEVPGGP